MKNKTKEKSSTPSTEDVFETIKNETSIIKILYDTKEKKKKI